jgi:hypothetical protein
MILPFDGAPCSPVYWGLRKSVRSKNPKSLRSQPPRPSDSPPGAVSPSPLLIFNRHYRVLHVDQVVLLHLPQFQPDFFRLELIVVADDHCLFEFLLRSNNKAALSKYRQIVYWPLVQYDGSKVKIRYELGSSVGCRGNPRPFTLVLVAQEKYCEFVQAGIGSPSIWNDLQAQGLPGVEGFAEGHPGTDSSPKLSLSTATAKWS